MADQRRHHAGPRARQKVLERRQFPLLVDRRLQVARPVHGAPVRLERGEPLLQRNVIQENVTELVKLNVARVEARRVVLVLGALDADLWHTDLESVSARVG